MTELKARLLVGSDPHEVEEVILGMESDARAGGEDEKLAGIEQAIEMASVVLAAVDRKVPFERNAVLRTPNLESLGPEGKYIFAGSDPESVEDPVLRAAYKKLIQENDDLLGKVGVERKKYDAAQYALKAASRIIETSNDRTKLLNSVQLQIESMSATTWAKELMLSALIPDYVAEPTPDIPLVPKSPQNPSELSAERPIEQFSSKISQEPLTGEKAPAVALTKPDSSVALEPRLIWPWVAAGAALMIVAWGVSKRRS